VKVSLWSAKSPGALVEMVQYSLMKFASALRSDLVLRMMGKESGTQKSRGHSNVSVDQ